MEKITTRRKIYEEIVLNPGLHFRELQKRLNIPTGVLEYHIGVLVREELVVYREDGKYKRFFANSTMTREERRIMGTLRSGVERKIVLLLLENGRMKHGELSHRLDISPSTLSYHLSKLVKNGIVDKNTEGRDRSYFVIRPEQIAKTMIKYRKSFLDSLVDNFAKWYMK